MACRHPPSLLAIVQRVQRALTPADLAPAYRDAKGKYGGHGAHCAVATEAVWIAKARELGYRNRVARLPDGSTHRWLVSPTGCVLDPTAAQFTKAQREALYARGRGGGPQGVRWRDGQLVPSPRAAKVLRRAGL